MKIRPSSILKGRRPGTLPPRVPSPVTSISGGTYTQQQFVTLSCSDVLADIYYTTDGSRPTKNSTLYSGQLTVSQTTTLRAIAVRSLFGDSVITQETYVIDVGAVTWPSSLDTGLLAYYKFDESSPTTQAISNQLVDETGNYPATVTGALYYGKGRRGYGIYFDGDVDKHISTGITSLSGGQARTFSTWLYCQSPTIVGINGVTFLGNDDGTFECKVAIGSTNPCILVRASISNKWIRFESSNVSILDDMHVIIRMPQNGNLSDIECIIDGTSIPQTDIEDWQGNTTTDEAINTSGAGLRIGRAKSWCWYGWLDEVGIWDVATDPTQDATLYNNGEGITKGNYPALYDWQPGSRNFPGTVDTVADRSVHLRILDDLQTKASITETLDSRRFDRTNATYIYIDSTSPWAGMDGSQSKPFKTIRLALDKVGGGALSGPVVVQLAPGTYKEGPFNLHQIQSTSTAPFIMTSDPTKSKPIIGYSTGYETHLLRMANLWAVPSGEFQDGTGTPNDLFQQGVSAQYREFSNLLFDGSYDFAPFGRSTWSAIEQGDTLRVLANEFQHFGHCCVKGLKNSIIDGNYFHDSGNTGWDHATYLPDHDNKVQRNVVVNQRGNLCNNREIESHGNIVSHNVCIAVHELVSSLGFKTTVAHNVMVNCNDARIGNDFMAWILPYRSNGSFARCHNNVFMSAFSQKTWISSGGPAPSIICGTVATNNYFEGTGWQDSDGGLPTNKTSGALTWATSTFFGEEAVIIANNGYWRQSTIGGGTTANTSAPATTDAMIYVSIWDLNVVQDGSCQWLYLGPVTTPNDTDFTSSNMYGQDNTGNVNFTDASIYDFTLPTGSVCLGAGIDIGYGTNLGPF